MVTLSATSKHEAGVTVGHSGTTYVLGGIYGRCCSTSKKLCMRPERPKATIAWPVSIRLSSLMDVPSSCRPPDTIIFPYNLWRATPRNMSERAKLRRSK